MLHCPICKKDVLPRVENPAFPFCSDRCKLIDLGKWLGEEYRMPSRPEEEEDHEKPELPTEHEHDA
jgi:hypothetical protein